MAKTASKTINISSLLNWANGYLSNSVGSNQIGRLGVAAMLEFTLFSAGTEFGYKELTPADNSQREYFIKE